MTGATPNLPATVSPGRPVPMALHDYIDELAAMHAGPPSPFGDDVEFPLAGEQVGYRHPGAADRPHLAGD